MRGVVGTHVKFSDDISTHTGTQGCYEHWVGLQLLSAMVW